MTTLAELPAFTGEVHPFAAKFPMLPDEELTILAESIKARGLLNPILIDPDGVLLDGRNRLAACEIAGVAPVFEVVNCGNRPADPLDIILDANETRRHMTATQRAAARAQVMHAQGKRVIGSNGQPRWKYSKRGENPESGFSKTDRNALDLCGKVVDHDPRLLDKVIAGGSLEAVLKQVTDEQAAAQAAAKAEAERAERFDQLARHGYTERISNGEITEDEAWTLYEKATEAQRKAEKQAAEWLRKLHDTYRDALLGIDTIAHPNNIPDVLRALASEPLDQMFKATTPEHVRARAHALMHFADAMEAQR